MQPTFFEHGRYPTIIEPELFERVQRIIAGSTSGRAPTTADYILRGKLICGCCGRPINGESGPLNAASPAIITSAVLASDGSPVKKKPSAKIK